MSLLLSVLRCPDSVAPETREVPGGEFSIGRGPDNDWVLADPERHLSKRHCVLAFRAGAWQLADVSTNGTFLNRETSPVGQGAPRPLRDGDRLHLGAYEIEVRVLAEADAFAASPAPLSDPFGDDPFAAPAFREDPLLAERHAPEAVQLPADFDPLAPDDAPLEPGFDIPPGAPTSSDHSPSLEDALRPPRPVTTLPDDWDMELAPPVPAQETAPSPIPPPAPEAASPPAPDPFTEPEDAAPPPPPPARRPLATLAASPEGLLAAFLHGAGLPDAAPADPEAAMEELGRAFRALVAGLRETLIARAAIKGEFRIEQTMIRRSGNNPLKFSAGDDDALAALLGTGRRTDMAPAAAVADALRDIRLHELASMSAMQAALRALVAQFDPAALRREAEQGGGLALVPAQRKARAWDLFERLHGRVSQGLADDFDSVFGKAFARAYEEAIEQLAARGETP